METEISNYSERRHQKSLFTCSSLWFYLIFIGFQDTPSDKAVRLFFSIISEDTKKPYKYIIYE